MNQDPPPLITYRRKGRIRRASGYVRDRNAPTGCLKVEPCNPNWKPVWVSPEEIRDGEDGPKRPAKPRSARKESSEPAAGDRTPETTPGDSREPTGPLSWEILATDGVQLIQTAGKRLECHGLTHLEAQAVLDALNRIASTAVQ